VTPPQHSSPRSQIPKTRVASGFSNGTTFFFELKHERSGVLVFGPKSPWKAAMWPFVFGVMVYLIEPLGKLVWGIFTLGNSSFNDPFFFDAFRWGALFIGFAIGAMLLVFYTLVRKWSPPTRFDMAQNEIHRPAIDSKFMGVHSRIEAMRMNFTDARAVQLCYGGFSKGDSESPGYDWWQLLLVGPGDPPFRAILVQSSQRDKMTNAGREIASYLSVRWVDDGDFRDPQIDAEGFDGNRVDADGAFVTAGSTADDPTVNPLQVREKPPSLSKRGEWIFGSVFVLLFAGIGWLIWTVRSMEKMDEAARVPAKPVPGSSVAVELTELLANGEKYRGRRIQTTGYVRFVTFLMNHHGKDNHLTLYALSPEPIDLSKRKKGGTIGETAVTNLLVQTTEWMDASFARGSDTNRTPKRTVVGLFTFGDKRHNLSLISWQTPEPAESPADK
jgi:hypothetical protein